MGHPQGSCSRTCYCCAVDMPSFLSFSIPNHGFAAAHYVFAVCSLCSLFFFIFQFLPVQHFIWGTRSARSGGYPDTAASAGYLAVVSLRQQTVGNLPGQTQWPTLLLHYYSLLFHAVPHKNASLVTCLHSDSLICVCACLCGPISTCKCSQSLYSITADSTSGDFPLESAPCKRPSI